MLVIGILGGVASGKSLVSDEFERLGAVHVDADRMGHEVLEERGVREAIHAEWGDEVFDDNNQVSRSQLAARVFGSHADAGEQLRRLEQITHPRIGDRIRQRLEEIRTQQPTAIVILDAPVMLKAGWDSVCDRILFVDAPQNVRLKRAVARGWTAEQFEAREKSQVSVEEKRKRADIVIDNSGPISQTYEQVRSFWHTLSL
jgi:dephospho-CoA kinase